MTTKIVPNRVGSNSILALLATSDTFYVCHDIPKDFSDLPDMMIVSGRIPTGALQHDPQTMRLWIKPLESDNTKIFGVVNPVCIVLTRELSGAVPQIMYIRPISYDYGPVILEPGHTFNTDKWFIELD